MKNKRTRTGCLTCRGRKIKCDETRPECTKCSNRKLQCSWSEKEPQTRTLSPLPLTVTERPGVTLPPLDLPNLQLLHHFTTITTYTLPHPRIRNSMPFSPQNVKTLSVFSPRHNFLVHAMLCAGAIHLALQTDDTAHFSLAESHFRAAIAKTQRLLDLDITREGLYSRRLLCNFLLMAYVSATGSTYSRRYFFSEIGLMSCRGEIFLAQDIVAPNEQHIIPLPPFVPSGTPPSVIFPDSLLSLVDPTICLDPEELLNDPVVYNAYKSTLVSMKAAWITFIDPEYVHSEIVFSRWAEALPQLFFILLQERRQRALVILAHYCGLMLSFEHNGYWYLRDVKRDLVKIAALMQERWFGEIEWPLSVLEYVG